MKIVLRIFVVALIIAGIGMVGCETAVKCSKNEDCKTAGQTCVAGTCKSAGEGGDLDGGSGDKAPPKACKEDKECADTELCKDKKCMPLPAKCTADTDCRATDVCVKDTGKCAKKCKFNEDCGDKEACDPAKKHCIKVKACTKLEDCDKGQACDTCRKVCVPSTGDKCNEDYNCPGGSDVSRCNKCTKECAKRLAPCEPCTKHEQCGQEGDLCLPDPSGSGKKFCGKACQSGVCQSKYKCKKFTGADFASSPSQCVPASGNCENPSECKSNSDCRSQGKICDVPTGKCIAGCEVDASCPNRTTSEKCTKSDDCKNKSATCISGVCVIKLKCCRGRCGLPCQVSSECEAQEKCDNGCCKLDGECTDSKDCKDKEYCNKDTGLCTPGCEKPDDCGPTDPQKQRCRWQCKNQQCVEDCSCRNPSLDCATPIRFCPTKEAQAKDPLAPCRKPKGPACKPCAGNAECGCKPGDDCLVACTKKECKKDDDCKGNGQATKCYNDRCSTKKKCRNNSECPTGEKCENGFCAENCNNMCINLQSGPRCSTACNPLGDGSECPSRMPCTELTPQDGKGPKCVGSGKRCKSDKDCSGKTGRCGEDGYCTDCAAGKVCRGFNQADPTDLVCIPLPPYVCIVGKDACEGGGF